MDCNLALMHIFNCNDNIVYVTNHQISHYCEGYTAKHSNDNETALGRVITALTSVVDKNDIQNNNFEEVKCYLYSFSSRTIIFISIIFPKQ